MIYLVPALQEYFTTYELATLTLINGLLGLFILLLVIFNPTFGAQIKLTLNDRYMRTEEDMSMIRTAYWNKINRLTLTRYSIRIKYQSGAPERFRLPFVSKKQHEKLRDRLINVSERYNIQFQEKPWWNPF